MTDDIHPDVPPPVEPLSDVAWARVERGLWARMDGSVTLQVPEAPRSRRWVWIAAPIVAAAATAIVFVATRESSPAGNETIANTGSDAGDVRVVAPPNEPANASFNDAHIELAPASAVVMRRSGTVLERGSAWFAVAPRVDRPAFVVLAGDTKVRVVGTKFRVARAANEDRVDVAVEHGLVEIQFRGNVKLVHANQSWTSERPDEVSPIKTAVAPPVPPDLEPAIDLEPAKAAPKPAPKAKPEPKKVESKVEPTKVEPKALEDERAKYERLTAIEKKDPAAAMVGYLELSQRSGKWAANALYAAGRLAADRRDPRAATILGVYIKRFPSGANVEDARSLLARISARSR